MYKVKGRDLNGCTDSAFYTLNVKESFRMGLTPSQAEICEGKSVSLQVAGANSYNWINNTSGLNNTSAATVVAVPLQTTVYTVVGYDAYNCFTDTANVTVTVNPLPTVDAGPDKEILPGEHFSFAPLASSDVTGWAWAPSGSLSCYDCASPIAAPQVETRYSVTVRTQKGCEATDEVIIKIACSESHIRIPNIFTPNRDGKNDLFAIKGISRVEHMAIYNRWGSIIFERNNFNPGDPSNCWDGTINGEPQPAGAYVYIIQLNCASGERFLKKGSFILVR
jgi:gliding motility-associated-like protein